MNTNVPLDRVKTHVVRPLTERDLIPLFLFRGNLSYNRAHSLVNMMCSFMEAEVLDRTEASSLSRNSHDLNHLCGIHTPITPMSIDSFVSRLLKCPEVTRLIPHLRDYVHELARGCYNFSLGKIDRFSTRSGREWRNPNWTERDISIKYAPQPFLARAKLQDESASFYPFITASPMSDHQMLLDVHDAVPRGIPESHRPDICQDLLVALLEGKIKQCNLKEEVPKFLKEVYKQFPDKYGPLYLETSISKDADGFAKDDGSFSLLDTLTEDNIRQRW